MMNPNALSLPAHHVFHNPLPHFLYKERLLRHKIAVTSFDENNGTNFRYYSYVTIRETGSMSL